MDTYDWITFLPMSGGGYDISKIDFDRLKQEFERGPMKNTLVQNLRQAVENRLQQHYERIVAEYNREKDRVTIEQTFEALLKLVQQLSDEESRAVREGLDEESMAIFDLLKKPDLEDTDTKRIKKVAVDLLKTLKAEKLRVDQWRDKETTRDAVRVTITNFLYSDHTGLPVGPYTEDDVTRKAEDVFHHVFRAYPTVPSPYYQAVPAL